MKRATKIQKMIQEYNGMRDRGSFEYAAADELFVEILKKMELGKIVRVGEERYEVVDNFAEKNTVWRAAAVRRYELKLVKPVRATKASRKKSKTKEEG